MNDFCDSKSEDHGEGTCPMMATLSDVISAKPNAPTKNVFDSLERFVLTEEDSVRKYWDLVLAALLMYTALVFPYTLCFVELKVPAETRPPTTLFSVVVKWIVDGLFWVDLAINFFCSYRASDGREVKNVMKIWRNYMHGYFVINFLACLPSEVFSLIFEYVANGSDKVDGQNAPKAARLARLQRLSRLVRLMRVIRLAKFHAFVSNNSVWKWIQVNVAAVRVVNLFGMLALATHILGCGWYLTAVFASDPADSWLGRRVIDISGNTLLESSGSTQWLQSAYFVFTILTTVGFGDMSAVNDAEIVYVLFVMIVGTIIHSIIVSEVITALTNVDASKKTVEAQKSLVEQFAQHTEMSKTHEMQLKEWLDIPRKGEIDFDREGMNRLFMSGKLPRTIIGKLPVDLFRGELMKSSFVTVCKYSLYGERPLPPRFLILLAALSTKAAYRKDDVLYHEHDYPYSIYIVLTGTFAYVRQKLHVSAPSRLMRSGSNMCLGSELSRQQMLSGSMSALFSSPSFRRNSKSDKPAATVVPKPIMWPYQLFSYRSYFGDVELLCRTSGRLANAVCMRAGEVLLLSKNDVVKITDEFPDLTSRWRKKAHQRENHRLALLERNREDASHFFQFAASVIQTYVRAKRQSKQRSLTKTEPFLQTKTSPSLLVASESQRQTANLGAQ
jgi:CRP-like cAMP-binding protein